MPNTFNEEVSNTLLSKGNVSVCCSPDLCINVLLLQKTD